MKSVVLSRDESTDEGTFGELTTDGFQCQTGELPWRDNMPGLSCIPTGIYTCTWIYSPSKGWHYLVQNVPNRSEILIHSANFVGDKSKGYQSQVLGCIAVGLCVSIMENQRALISSKLALSMLEDHLAKLPFELTIIGA